MRERLTVGDLMVTALITVHPDDTVSNAHADMELGSFHHLPVVDLRGRLVGILSERDILLALSKPKATTVAQVMTRNPVTVGPDRHAHAAAALMIDRKIGSLPVVGDDGRLIGLITQTDFLRVARRALQSLPLAV